MDVWNFKTFPLNHQLSPVLLLLVTFHYIKVLSSSQMHIAYSIFQTLAHVVPKLLRPSCQFLMEKCRPGICFHASATPTLASSAVSYPHFLFLSSESHIPWSLTILHCQTYLSVSLSHWPLSSKDRQNHIFYLSLHWKGNTESLAQSS